MDFLDKFKAAQKHKVAPPARTKRRLFDRCLLNHEGQQIVFDLTTAKTCPPGFTGLKKGGGVYGRVVAVESKARATRKRRAKTAAAPAAKAVKAPARKPRKKAAPAAPAKAKAVKAPARKARKKARKA